MRSFSHKGFTLIELLVSIAIIGIITSIVLVKHTSFDSTVLLKSAAYEIAMTVREAQVKSLSQVRNGTDEASFNYPFGVTFTPLSKTYDAFRFPSATAYPNFTGSVLNTFTLDRTMRVFDVCVYGTGLADPCNVDRLDISFRRPEFKALFYAVSGSNNYSTTITSAKIKVNSSNGASGTFVIEVSQLGQISVVKE